ncbi:LuxR C-terminal-related transcriptional regulator [Microbacterium sp. P05]|uniref:helix-turn-helix transcriptional regulator n=1 Tax=Microbacterium sp. P05 TaxID=3366948 RepID=UPI0037477620
MTSLARTQTIEALDRLTLEALQAVAALGHLLVRDIPVVLGEHSVPVHQAVEAGLLSLREGSLRPADPRLGAAALEVLSRSDRRDLHLRLARRSVSEFDAVRQQDLGTDEGENTDLALALERAALKSEQAGRVDLAVEFWARSARRSAGGATDRNERELRLAAEEYRKGGFRSVASILEALEWGRLTEDQAERAIGLLTSSIYRTSGLAAARMRAQNLLEALPADHPHRNVLRLAVSGLGENFAVVQHQLEAHLPRLRSERHSAPFRHSLLSKLLYAKVNAGAGLDAALVADLERLQQRVPRMLLEDTVEAQVALYAYTIDEIASSRRGLAALLVQSEIQGDEGFRQILVVHAAQVDTMVGRFGSAEQRLTMSGSQAPHLAAAPAGVRAGGLLALEQGRYDDVAQIIGRVPETGVDPLGHLTRAALRGILLSRSGDARLAVRHLEEAIRTAGRLGVAEPGRRLWVDVELARAYIDVGDIDRARSLAAALAGLADRTGRTLPRLQARRIEAWLTGAEGSPREIHDSTLALLALAETMEWVPERARLIAEALRLVRGVPVDQTQRSAITHTARGAIALLEDGDARRSLRGELRRWEQSRISELTAGERRVAELIAGGVSNKAAGDILHLSPRTIESHLRNVFIKLEITSRSQLIAQFSDAISDRAA